MIEFESINNNIVSSKDGCTPLHEAARGGHVAAINLLWKRNKKKNANVRDNVTNMKYGRIYMLDG
jgi:ankyrin repeat protein